MEHKYEDKDKERLKHLNPIDDDFLIKMAEDLSFCKEVIQIATGNPHIQVVQCEPQKVVKNLQGRSVTLDILCKDEKDDLFLVEVQKADNDDHVRRVRYNTSCVTVNVTDTGEKFQEIKDIISIYISKNDFIGKNMPDQKRRAVYHVDRVVRELGTILDNGITEIYVNSKVEDGSAAARLMRVFTQDDAYDYDVCPRTSERKKYLKEDDKGVQEMCAIMDEIRNESMAEGRAEGRAEGDAKRLVANINNLVKNLKLSLEAACQAVGSSIEEYEESKKLIQS